MKTKLEAILKEAVTEIGAAASSAQIQDIRVKYLGKKGELTSLLKMMGKLSAEERPVIGQLANDIRENIESALRQRTGVLEVEELAERIGRETIDITMPGKPAKIGKPHPLNKMLAEALDIFIGLGFEIAEGPEVETTYYNFTALGTYEGHPARDPQDTFYIAPEVVLRTQTSPVQIRVMENRKPPIKIVSPGRVYRKDEVDATHSPMFHQIEGLVVDRGITMGDLKGTLNTIVRGIYGQDAQIRFRPHHFPFTEPSAEVDVMCFGCGGAGCRMCKGEGWIELLGCGMVHPNVLRVCGIDPDEYSGFAFGIGLERLAMRRFEVSDMRLFFENDVRFLSQF